MTLPTTISAILFTAGLWLTATSDGPDGVCVPAWLLLMLAAFAMLPTDTAVDVVRHKLGLPVND